MRGKSHIVLHGLIGCSLLGMSMAWGQAVSSNQHQSPREITSETLSPAGPPTMQRGHRWVRSHPFTIMGLTRMTPRPFDADQYREANMSALLAWEPSTFDELLPIASANRLPYHLYLDHWGDEQTNREGASEQSLREALGELDSEENRAYIRNLISNPGCIGWLVNDEPVVSTYMRYTRHMLKWLRQLHPEALAYCNARPEGEMLLGPDYERYIDDFAAIIDPDVLMVDVYPLGDLEEVDGWVHAESYFNVLEVVRHVALEQGMPYWLFIQSFETHNGWHRRLPSESDIRFQLFTPLTYGYTGIAYFTYDIAFERGLIEADGQPNRLYHHAAQANTEVANLGTALRFLTSTDVRFVRGQHGEGSSRAANPIPRGATAWSYGAGNDHQITDVAVESPGEYKDGLLGFFTDDRGEPYFMLTNLWHDKGGTAEDFELTFTVRFKPQVTELYRLNRLSGNVETVEVTGGELTIRLPGGTGDLFRYTPGPFPGRSADRQH